MKLDALVLAGNRKDYIPVGDRNKALLDVGGRPVIEYILNALEAASCIDKIYIVGPVEDLAFLKQRHPGIVLLEQGDTLADNVLNSYETICPDHDRHLFITTSDIPFIQPREVDDFVSSSEFEQSDIVIGVVGDSVLNKYLPVNGIPGIRNNCCHFRQGSVRLNNLFIMRYPSSMLTGYASTIYSVRYQKKALNFLRLIVEVIVKSPGSIRLILTLLLMQATLQADRFGFKRAAGLIGMLLDIGRAEKIASRAIGGKFRSFMMDYGGAALDIDNDESLRAARERFEEFMATASGLPKATANLDQVNK